MIYADCHLNKLLFCERMNVFKICVVLCLSIENPLPFVEMKYWNFRNTWKTHNTNDSAVR